MTLKGLIYSINLNVKRNESIHPPTVPNLVQTHTHSNFRLVESPAVFINLFTKSSELIVYQSHIGP